MAVVPEEGRLRFRWSEHGGPPVAVSQHRGFGTHVSSKTWGANLRASATLLFEPEGLICTIDAKLI